MADTVNGTTSASASSASKSGTGLPQSFTYPANLPSPPFINIGGIANFRDVGGYITASSYFSSMRAGGSTASPTMVRRNLIYRCAIPQLVTPEGNKELTETYGIKHIFDLRSPPEVRKISASLPQTSSTDAVANPHSKALEPEGIMRHFVPVYESEDEPAQRTQEKSSWYTEKQTVSSKLPYAYSEGFVSAYRDIALYATISSQSCPSHNAAAYPTILRQLLAHPDEPIIFHCTAGKDRTGVLAAILLRLAGVDDETIGWEYALTEPGLGEWRDLFIRRIANSGMGGAGADKHDDENGTENEHTNQNGAAPNKDDEHATPEATPSPIPGTTPDQIDSVKQSKSGRGVSRSEAATIVGARSGNMRAFLKLVLDEEFGGVEKYLTARCGLSREDVEKLRDILVVPVTKVEDVVPVGNVKIEGWTAEGGVQDSAEDSAAN